MNGIYEYKIFQHANSIYIYDFKAKQLFTIKERSAKGHTYRCRNRKCGAKLLMVNGRISRNQFSHNHGGNEKQFHILMMCTKVDDYIRRLGNETTNRIPESSQIYDEVLKENPGIEAELTSAIRKRIQRKKLQYERIRNKNLERQRQLKNHIRHLNDLKAKYPQTHSKLSASSPGSPLGGSGQIGRVTSGILPIQKPGPILNALGKELLSVVIDTLKGLKENDSISRCIEEHLERKAQINTETERKILCSVCYANECDKIFMPCLHMICTDCWNLIRTKINSRKTNSRKPHSHNA